MGSLPLQGISTIHEGMNSLFDGLGLVQRSRVESLRGLYGRRPSRLCVFGWWLPPFGSNRRAAVAPISIFQGHFSSATRTEHMRAFGLSFSWPTHTFHSLDICRPSGFCYILRREERDKAMARSKYPATNQSAI